MAIASVKTPALTSFGMSECYEIGVKGVKALAHGVPLQSSNTCRQGLTDASLVAIGEARRRSTSIEWI